MSRAAKLLVLSRFALAAKLDHNELGRTDDTDGDATAARGRVTTRGEVR